MPNSVIPANAEGLSKFSRRSTVSRASRTSVMTPKPSKSETIDDEVWRLWMLLSDREKCELVAILKDLSEIEAGPELYRERLADWVERSRAQQ